MTNKINELNNLRTRRNELVDAAQAQITDIYDFIFGNFAEPYKSQITDLDIRIGNLKKRYPYRAESIDGIVGQFATIEDARQALSDYDDADKIIFNELTNEVFLIINNKVFIRR